MKMPDEIQPEDEQRRRRIVTYTAETTRAAKPASPQIAGRVERLREVSASVLDEAAIDPSVRFVLVAIVLFLIFVALFVASTLFR